MGNEQNLIPFTTEQSREKAKENGRKGGIASGIAKRRKKSMKEVLTMLLELQAPDKQREKLAEYGIEDSDQTNKTMVAVGLMERASAGDPRAVEVLCEISGEFESESEIPQTVELRFVDASIPNEDNDEQGDN